MKKVLMLVLCFAIAFALPSYAFESSEFSTSNEANLLDGGFAPLDELGSSWYEMTEEELAYYRVDPDTNARAIVYEKYALIQSSGTHTVYSSSSATSSSVGTVKQKDRIYVFEATLTTPRFYRIRFKTTANVVKTGYIEASKVFIPTSGYTRPIRSGTIGWEFGDGVSYNNTGHTGVDVLASTGTPLYAVVNGSAEYRFTTTNINGVTYSANYGKHVRLTNGNKTALYAHMSSFAGHATEPATVPSTYDYYGSLVTIENPAQVTCASNVSLTQDQVLGYVGNTGNSSAPHLHFEILVNGSRVDPFLYTIFPSEGVS